MESFNASSLSAYFPGLVDVCINDDGQVVYAIVKDGKLVFEQEYKTETETFSIPDKKHFQFSLPRVAEVMRCFTQEDPTLYDDLLSYLKRFSALDDEQWELVAHYVFLTYLHDNPGIDYCPYLLFNAVPERGKSRTGKSIIYVAFRGIHLVELREATIFRYSQYFRGTLFFDLMDISKKAERGNSDDILLLRAEKGAKCCRIQNSDDGPFHDMVYFDIYGPTIISSNEALNQILETRCLPITMPNRPGNYENPRPELALELKERMTAWRAKHLFTIFADMEPIEGITGRLWDIGKPMLFVNSLLPVDSRILTESILAIAGEKEESRKNTVEGRLVAIIKDITSEFALHRFAEWSIKVSDIRARYNQGKPENRHASSPWIGKRLKSMSFHNRMVKGYSEILITADEYAMILKQYRYASGESAKPTHYLPHSLPEKAKQDQIVLREVEGGRESAQEHPDFNSPSERELYEETLQALKDEGWMSDEEMERSAYKVAKESRKYDDISF